MVVMWRECEPKLRRLIRSYLLNSIREIIDSTLIGFSLHITVPILPIFLFQNELKLSMENNPGSEIMSPPKVTEEILLEKIVHDSMQVEVYNSY